MKTLFSSLLVIVITCFLSISLYQAYLNQKTPILSPDDISYNSLYDEAFRAYILVNNYRTNHGISPLRYTPKLCSFAISRLNQIMTESFSHAGFKKDVYKTYCTDCTFAGENLARGYTDANSLVSSWIASPEHLANIIDPKFTDTCLMSGSDNNGPYAVQEFASY